MGIRIYIFTILSALSVACCVLDEGRVNRQDGANSLNVSDSVHIIETQVDSCVIVYGVNNSEFEFANYCDTGHVYYFNDSLQYVYNVAERFYVGRWRGGLAKFKGQSQTNEYTITIPELLNPDIICDINILRLQSNGDSTLLLDTVVSSTPLKAYFDDVIKEDVDSLLVRVQFTHPVLKLSMPEMSANWVMVQPKTKAP